MQISHTKFGEIVHPVRDAFQITGEQVRVSGVSQHLGMLKPLRIGMAS
jgi:hypothetical protein